MLQFRCQPFFYFPWRLKNGRKLRAPRKRLRNFCDQEKLVLRKSQSKWPVPLRTPMTQTERKAFTGIFGNCNTAKGKRLPPRSPTKGLPALPTCTLFTLFFFALPVIFHSNCTLLTTPSRPSTSDCCTPPSAPPLGALPRSSTIFRRIQSTSLRPSHQF